MIPQHLLELAPEDLPYRRSVRYDGSGMDVTLDALAPDDRALARQVYEGVLAVALACPGAGRPECSTAEFVARVMALGADPFLGAAQALGRATVAQTPSPLVKKVLHDIRGGALTALVGMATWAELEPLQPDQLAACWRLARDQCKVMRNALTDLDPARRTCDTLLKPHGVEEIVRAWDGTSVHEHGHAVAVTVRCTYRGGVAACCLETSALDRVLFNHLNNAARFTADGRVTLSVFGVGGGHLVRWVVCNAVAPAQKEWLTATVGSDLGRLYAGGVTRGGSGIGLASCSDFVAAAFGLAPADAVAQGYLGAKLNGDEYHAWFHWPALGSGAPPVD